jgi:hypothetical protein
VALLEMAARDGVEALLAQRLDELLVIGELPDVKRLREEFAPRKTEVPHVTVVIPPASRYDALLPSGQVDDLQDESQDKLEALAA